MFIYFVVLKLIKIAFVFVAAVNAPLTGTLILNWFYLKEIQDRFSLEKLILNLKLVFYMNYIFKLGILRKSVFVNKYNRSTS